MQLQGLKPGSLHRTYVAAKAATHKPFGVSPESVKACPNADRKSRFLALLRMTSEGRTGEASRGFHASCNILLTFGDGILR
jgi:hypothetical protein